jgi:hypothetical protein
VHRQLAEAEGHEEADELVVLVQVVLRRDVVFPAVGRAGEVQLGGEGDVGVVEGDQPDGEDLGDVEVEDEILGVVGWRRDVRVGILWNGGDDDGSYQRC